jgi:hypothetical protein
MPDVDPEDAARNMIEPVFCLLFLLTVIHVDEPSRRTTTIVIILSLWRVAGTPGRTFR